jgi:hypothetical protein
MMPEAYEQAHDAAGRDQRLRKIVRRFSLRGLHEPVAVDQRPQLAIFVHRARKPMILEAAAQLFAGKSLRTRRRLSHACSDWLQSSKDSPLRRDVPAGDCVRDSPH